MELLQLFYFRETAKTENMTEAAGILHITQPSLSKAIARLEEELGVPLFDRSRHRLRHLAYAAGISFRYGIYPKGIVDSCKGTCDEAQHLDRVEYNLLSFGSGAQLPSVRPRLFFLVPAGKHDRYIRRMTGRKPLCYFRFCSGTCL